MQSVIKELWYGRICPQEAEGLKKPELKELQEYMSRHRENLEKTMTEEQKEIYERFMDCRNEYDELVDEEMFTYGFKLGIKLMTEAVEE